MLIIIHDIKILIILIVVLIHIIHKYCQESIRIINPQIYSKRLRENNGALSKKST